MRLYLCGHSALSMLRYLRSIGDDRLFDPPARVKSLVDPICGLRDLAGVGPKAELLLGHAGETVHALAPKREQARSRGNLQVHLWSAKVPASAFIKLTDDLYVSSPAFVFLQMARELDEVALAKLGMELCGTYSLPEKRTPYIPGSVDETVYELLAIATAKRISALCEAADDSVFAVRKARRVAKWLVDGSASPMETATYLLLCMPKYKGGYGLPKPVLNPKVMIANTSGEEERFPDLYWKDGSVDIEYQSDLAHGGDWNHYKDSKRQVKLTANKISVLMLTKPQFKSEDDFHELAIGVHRLLGIQIRYLDDEWKKRRSTLRESVFES